MIVGQKVKRWIIDIFYYIFSFIGVFISPIWVANNIKEIPSLWIIVSSIVYIFIWLFNFVIMLDSASYIYGFLLPLHYRKYIKPVFTNSKTERPFSFIKNSLLSYALTLYGFSVAYVCLSQLDICAFNPNKPFDFLTAIYFTIVTAATVGYGDISPVSNSARLLVTIEIIVSFLYLIFIFSTIAGFARASSLIEKIESENETFRR